MGSARTEDAFKAAVRLETEGDAHADYAEWLLERNRDADALAMLPPAPAQVYYLHFLRGLAFERSQRREQARDAYRKFRDFSASFPVSARFRIKDSRLQRDSGIRFDDENGRTRTTGRGGLSNITAELNDQQGINGLSYMIFGEAGGESYGGMLAAGWLARARVLRGNVADPATCPAVTRTGTTLADWYKSVICQSAAFDGSCDAWCADPTITTCSSSTSTNSAAYDVFYGKKSDPVSGHCPGGVATAGSLCTGTLQTCVGSAHSYKLASPLFNLGIVLATQPSCPAHSCAPNAYDKVCGNGGQRDNCFYGNSACAGAKRFAYNGTLTTTTRTLYSAVYQATLSGTHKGHMEGPETGVNFDLFLEQSSTSTGPWTVVASTTQPHSVEDVDHPTTGTAYYRWRVTGVTGTGFFTLCTRRP